MLKGALFDLDGTLIDTEGLQWKSWIAALKPFGIPLSREKYFDYTGKSGIIIADELVREYDLKIAKEVLLGQKEKFAIGLFKTEPLAILPFAIEAVEFFINKKIKTAVVSGGTREEVVLKLGRSKLARLFDKIISGEEVDRSKPYPDIYLAAIKSLGAAPDECVSFEDTENGVLSAKEAGLVCIAIPNKFSYKQNFSASDAVVPDLKEGICRARGFYRI